MIDKYYIRQNFHNQAIQITLMNNTVFFGVIMDDSEDYCRVIKNLNLREYRETKSESLIERIYFKDMKSVDYQKK